MSALSAQFKGKSRSRGKSSCRSLEYNPQKPSQPSAGRSRSDSQGMVRVSDPRTEGGRFKKHTTYSVSVEGDGELFAKNLRRRYNDFVWLRGALTRRFPGVLVPPLPKKKLIGRNDKFKESRMRGLQRFLYLVLQTAFLADSGCVKSFLSVSDFESERKLENKRSPRVADLTAYYKIVFADAAALAPINEPIEQILVLRDFLRSSKQSMSSMLDATNKIISSYSRISSKMELMATTLDDMQRGEDFLTGEAAPIHKVVVLQGFCTLFGSVGKQPNAWMNTVSETVELEVRNFEAMLEAVAAWMSYDKKRASAVKRNQKYVNSAKIKDPGKKQADLLEEKELTEFVGLLAKITLRYNLSTLWKTLIDRFRNKMDQFIYTQKLLSKDMVEMYTSLTRGMREFQGKLSIPPGLYRPGTRSSGERATAADSKNDVDQSS